MIRLIRTWFQRRRLHNDAHKLRQLCQQFHLDQKNVDRLAQQAYTYAYSAAAEKASEGRSSAVVPISFGGSRTGNTKLNKAVLLATLHIFRQQGIRASVVKHNSEDHFQLSW